MSNIKPGFDEFRNEIQKQSKRFEDYYLWLEKNMPRSFFQEVPAEWIPLIVHALMGFKVQDYFVEIHLKNAAVSLCIDTPDADVLILQNYANYGINSYTTYVSRDSLSFEEIQGYVRIATLNFTEAIESEQEPLSINQSKELAQLLSASLPELNVAKSHELIKEIDPRFLRKLPKELQLLTLKQFYKAKDRDLCQYEIHYIEDWKEKESPSAFIVLAWQNTPKHSFLYHLAQAVYRHKLSMRKVNASYLHPHGSQNVLMLSFWLHGADGKAAWETADMPDFLQELATLKYFESFDAIDTSLVEPGFVSGNMGNFLRALSNFVHHVLVNADPNLYTLENIEEGLCRHPELSAQLCQAFAKKFDPLQSDLKAFETIKNQFLELVSQLDTGHEFHDIRRKNILLQGMNFIDHTLKTNFFVVNKTALAFRVDPNYLDEAPFDRKKLFPELPFGIFFIKGMDFIAYHIRFKDLSRGGLRTVYPEKKEKMLAERNTVFVECYQLAYTQHKKNKDIPEGGAKGIIFLNAYERLENEASIFSNELKTIGLSKEEIEKKILIFTSKQKLDALYQAQRSFIKNLLSLINCTPDGVLREKEIIDYWNKPEYIYLGPDENMHDSMIEWIANESKKEHYKPGGAFISGKPKIGINHKEYGVTSLGVNVCMHETLKFLGIDPLKTPFTVKMTGGPDGDVAGNQIYNLFRFYPKTAKLVALTDVSGTIFDPKGLDLEACTHLFHEGKPIRLYPHEKLSKGGFLLDKENKREPTPYQSQTLCWMNKEGKVSAEWLSSNEANTLYRNNVHHVKADIFIPCGGRPRTLREGNHKDFLDREGNPTAHAIIEGANLYLSSWARHFLENKGVLIIKDSSANKGGVICSSFEILCSLALHDEEFLKYKTILTTEILERIKQCALDEAHLLFKTHREKGLLLTDISDEISKRINFFTDQLLSYLENLHLPNDPSHPLVQCFLSYCPKTLREKFEERLLKEIPDNHKKAVIASYIASRLVYQRGLDWFPSIVDILPLLLQEKTLF